MRSESVPVPAAELKPYQGSVAEAFMQLKLLRRRLILEEIDKDTYEALAAPYAEIVNRKIRELALAGII